MLLALVGLAMAVAVWNNGHPILGALVAFLFVGGAGWMIPVWMGRAKASQVCVPPDARRRLHELVDEWERRHLGGLPPDILVALYGRNQQGWPSAAAFLDQSMPLSRPATAGRFEVPCHGHTSDPTLSDLSGDGRLIFDDDGFVVFEHPATGASMSVNERVTKWEEIMGGSAEDEDEALLVVTLGRLDAVVAEPHSDRVSHWLGKHHHGRFHMALNDA